MFPEDQVADEECRQCSVVRRGSGEYEDEGEGAHRKEAEGEGTSRARTTERLGRACGRLSALSTQYRSG
jgi:hypothetical protein